jgi:UDP-N-acetylglucosamine:LPS N-acetylglucosamine transferase
MKKTKKTVFCFVCSSGGHFVEALDIARKLNLSYADCIVSGNLEYNGDILNVINAPQADRDLNVTKQFWFAMKYLIIKKPNIIISTGAGIAVPFFIFAKFYSCRTIYIETPTAIYKPTLTCRIAQFLVDRLYVRSIFLVGRINNAIIV